MKSSNRFSGYLCLLAVFSICVAVFSAGLRAQEEGWRIIRADFGHKTERADVTNLLIQLVASGGDRGRIPVNEVTMGGNPAPGKDKSLHVLARNRHGEEREFEFKEHTYLDVRIFDVRDARREEWDDRRPNREGHDQEGPDREEWNRLTILRGFYGVQGNTANVTDLVRSRIRDGMLAIRVTNGALGGDPAPGANKVLIVVYRYQGNESATAVAEGNTLTIP
jgi:hypothetical protein